MIRSLFFGLSLPLRSLKLIVSNPVLMLFSAIPIVITFTLYGFVIHGLQTWARTTVSAFLLSHQIPAEGFVATLILILTWAVLLLVSALTFSFVAGIASSPFNDFLAEKVEPRATPPLPTAPSKGWRGSLRVLMIDVAKTLAAACMGILALVTSWVPGLNIVSFALAFLLVAFQFLSYPQTRRGQGIRTGLHFIRKHPLASLGFGTVSSVLFAIPVVSGFALPLAVVGGTLLFARAEAPVSREFPYLS